MRLLNSLICDREQCGEGVSEASLHMLIMSPLTVNTRKLTFLNVELLY